jgi:histidine ammonia-lyase
MPDRSALLRTAAIACLAAAGALPGRAALADGGYVAITPSAAGTTVTLTGHDLTIEQVIQVARYGAKVQLSAEARKRSADAYGLLLEAAAEGISVYWFNRGSGAGRETVIFAGDPTSADNRPMLEQRQLAIFQHGATAGLGPEIDEEEVVRAMMVVRANCMSFEAASPQLTQMLLDLLNDRITPVVQSRGTVGEGDLGPFSNIGATMVGAGEAYYQGVRMSAAQALVKAGLTPLQPFAADDSALTSSNAYATGRAALLIHDARRVLDWADLIYAIDLNGMNSSITPLSMPVQSNRPFKWLNWNARRILGLLRGSYLFSEDEHRIIQDPESMRASSIRQASAWQAWSALKADVLIQMNSSDHNPAVRVGISPQDSWELNTPQFLKYYIKGGAHSHGQHGFILSNANWDPYPMATDIEAFTIALSNVDVAVAQRINRFTSTFFTVIRPGDVLTAQQSAVAAPGSGVGSAGIAAAIYQEIQSLSNPVTPEGNPLILTVEDLQAQTRLKITRARAVVEDSYDLLAEDLLTGTYWLDVRLAQDASRHFGAAPTAAWTAFRATLPFTPAAASATTPPTHEIAAAFLRANAAAGYFGEAGNEPPPESASAAFATP